MKLDFFKKKECQDILYVNLTLINCKYNELICSFMKCLKEKYYEER